MVKTQYKIAFLFLILIIFTGCNFLITVDDTIPVSSVSLEEDFLILKGESYPLTAEILPENASNKNVVWSSSDETIGTVSSSGVFTASSIKSGNVTITVTTEDGDKTDQVVAYVSSPVASVSLEDDFELLTGDTYQLYPTILPVDALITEVTWDSSNESIATVSSTGLVTADANNTGSAVITVTTEEGNKTDAVTVTVTDAAIPVSSVSLEDDFLILKGESYPLTAEILPVNATNKNVVWSSSNETIGTISSSGVFTASSINSGNVTITVTTEDGNKTDQVVAYVSSPVASVSLVEDFELFTGDTYQLYPTILPVDALITEVTWESSNESIATVSSTGLVTTDANNTGSAVITVTTLDGNKTDEVVITVKKAVSSIRLGDDISLINGETTQLTADILPEDASNKNVTWSSSNESIATVSSTGLVTADASNTGTTTITATTEEGSKTDSITLTVNAYVAVTGILIENSLGGALTPPFELDENESKNIRVVISPANASDSSFTISSSPEGIASFTLGGSSVDGQTVVVNGLSVGPTTLTVTSNDNPSITDTLDIAISADEIEPTIEYASVMDNHTILLSFSENMGSGFTNIANYEVFEDPEGANTQLTISQIDDRSHFYNSGISINIAETLVSGSTYRIVVNNIADLSGNDLAADSQVDAFFAPPHGIVLDMDYVSDTGGKITMSSGATSYPTGSHWVSDANSGTYFAFIKDSDILDMSNMLAAGLIGVNGISANIIYGTPSALISIDTMEEKIFADGQYDIYLSFIYDVDGDFSTTDDQVDVISEPFTFEVVTE